MTMPTSSLSTGPAKGYPPALVLTVAVLAGSFAAVFMRAALEAGIPALLVAAGRLGLAALFLTPLVLHRYRAELQRLSRSDLLYVLLSGLLIGLHFMLIARSLQFTSVLIASVLINSGPIWVALLERFFLRARLRRAVWIGIGVTFAGSGLIALSGLNSGAASGGSVEGSLLALTGAIAGSGYLVAGRKVRSRISIVPYVWMIFGSGGIVALAVMLLTATPLTGYAPEGYLWLLLITLIPQLIGHSGFNYVIGYMPATLVSLSGQVITALSAVWGFLMFHEVPGAVQVIASAIIVAGVVIAVVGQHQPPRNPPIARDPGQTSKPGASLPGGSTG
ncbi:MAG: DMT family transporter [Anaerolineae bacterium]|nr:DMT family transporter [Anaerolineae bacterium]